MKFEDFQSGQYIKQYQYQSFMPVSINREWTWNDPRVNVLLEDAVRKLGELNTYTLMVTNVDLFIHMHIVKEADLSGRIEGTKTELDEAVLSEEEFAPERRDGRREVQHYARAMNTAIETLDTLPLSLRLLRRTHEVLMTGARGEHKTPGEFRRSQNRIEGGFPPGCRFCTASPR